MDFSRFVFSGYIDLALAAMRPRRAFDFNSRQDDPLGRDNFAMNNTRFATVTYTVTYLRRSIDAVQDIPVHSF